MKKTLLILFFIPFLFASQTIKDIDDLTFSICKNLQENKDEKTDSIRIQNAFNENIPKFATKFKISEFSNDLISRIFGRLQRNCDEYQKMTNQNLVNDKESNWKLIDKKPQSKVLGNQCGDYFKKHHNFYYYEGDGDKTQVKIGDGFWEEIFLDGTTSTLSFKLYKCEFDLEFIESNNQSRKSFSVKGDKYVYEVIEIGDDALQVIVKSDGSDSYYKFKLYPSD